MDYYIIVKPSKFIIFIIYNFLKSLIDWIYIYIFKCFIYQDDEDKKINWIREKKKESISFVTKTNDDCN